MSGTNAVAVFKLIYKNVRSFVIYDRSKCAIVIEIVKIYVNLCIHILRHLELKMLYLT